MKYTQIVGRVEASTRKEPAAFEPVISDPRAFSLSGLPGSRQMTPKESNRERSSDKFNGILRQSYPTRLQQNEPSSAYRVTSNGSSIPKQSLKSQQSGLNQNSSALNTSSLSSHSSSSFTQTRNKSAKATSVNPSHSLHQKRPDSATQNGLRAKYFLLPGGKDTYHNDPKQLQHSKDQQTLSSATHNLTNMYSQENGHHPNISNALTQNRSVEVGDISDITARLNSTSASSKKRAIFGDSFSSSSLRLSNGNLTLSVRSSLPSGVSMQTSQKMKQLQETHSSRLSPQHYFKVANSVGRSNAEPTHSFEQGKQNFQQQQYQQQQHQQQQLNQQLQNQKPSQQQQLQQQKTVKILSQIENSLVQVDQTAKLSSERQSQYHQQPQSKEQTRVPSQTRQSTTQLNVSTKPSNIETTNINYASIMSPHSLKQVSGMSPINQPYNYTSSTSHTGQSKSPHSRKTSQQSFDASIPKNQQKSLAYVSQLKSPTSVSQQNKPFLSPQARASGLNIIQSSMPLSASNRATNFYTSQFSSSTKHSNISEPTPSSRKSASQWQTASSVVGEYPREESSASRKPSSAQISQSAVRTSLSQLEGQIQKIHSPQVSSIPQTSKRELASQINNDHDFPHVAADWGSLAKHLMDGVARTAIPNHEKTKFSAKRNGIVKCYSANTNQGLIRNYNEDRVSIILNITKPNVTSSSASEEADRPWPTCSFFGVYDGHGGAACADFLRDNLHQYVIRDPNFPSNPKQAIIDGFAAAESDFLEEALKKTSENGKPQQQSQSFERSGSCAIVVIIVGTRCYVANVGDSRAIMSADGGRKAIDLSRDHKPLDEIEHARIADAGGKIYQQYQKKILVKAYYFLLSVDIH